MADKIDDRIMGILSKLEPMGSMSEWAIACRLHDWNDNNRSKHGAWIRSIVQVLWRLERRGLVSHFWASHGEGVPGDRMWLALEKPNERMHADEQAHG